MMDPKALERARAENYVVMATLSKAGRSINLPCKVYLPERFGTDPHIILKSPGHDSRKIMEMHSCSFEAEVPISNGSRHLSLFAPEVWLRNSSTQHWGHNLTETTTHGEPRDLHVVMHHSSDDATQETEISFVISPNRMLEPSMPLTTSFTGSVEYQRLDNIEFTLGGNQIISIDRHFDYRSQDNGDLVQWSRVIATLKTRIPAEDVASIKANVLTLVDDLLLIASVAARQRIVCLGWTAFDSKAHTTFYRGDKVLPPFTEGTSFHLWLVKRELFHDFIQSSFNAFLDYGNKHALRSALHALVPMEQETVEMGFLHLFAGLETLVLDFRRTNNLEVVLPDSDWKIFKDYVQKSIKDCPEPKLSKEQRSAVYSKLGELNRVSLREAFDAFVVEHSLFVSDLWPVFGSKESLGLAEIRNRLIHGDPIPPGLIDPLITARDHLHRLLERAVVRLFKSDEYANVLSHNNHDDRVLTTDIPSARARLSGLVAGPTDHAD